MKKCSKCGVEKELTEFHKFSRSADGHQPKCKQCVKEYAIKNKEHIAQYHKEHNQNPEVKAKNKLVRKQKYLNNKEHYDNYNKKYKEQNIDKVREYHKNWQKNRRANDISFKIAHRMRNRLREALKKNCKAGKTQDLLGCTLEEFKIYFESKFTEGMTWEKFMNSEIHIDHEIPCCAFDLSKEDEQRKCFHYSNLKPMWEIDNKKKNGKDREIAKERLMII